MLADSAFTLANLCRPTLYSLSGPFKYRLIYMSLVSGLPANYSFASSPVKNRSPDPRVVDTIVGIRSDLTYMTAASGAEYGRLVQTPLIPKTSI
jgi:hypothetical protein